MNDLVLVSGSTNLPPMIISYLCGRGENADIVHIDPGSLGVAQLVCRWGPTIGLWREATIQIRLFIKELHLFWCFSAITNAIILKACSIQIFFCNLRIFFCRYHWKCNTIENLATAPIWECDIITFYNLKTIVIVYPYCVTGLCISHRLLLILALNEKLKSWSKSLHFPENPASTTYGMTLF